MIWIPYPSIILHGLIFGVFLSLFWKAGQMEDPGTNRIAWLWTALSLAVFAATWLWLDFGYLALVLCQLALGITIGIARAVPSLLRDSKQ